MIVNMLLEGHLEEPVALKLIRHCGHVPGTVYGKKGCSFVQRKAKGYVYLARGDRGMLVLTDFMDTDCACPPQALRRYMPARREPLPAAFLFRFAVNELESWLMADREALSYFLRIAMARIPEHPEEEADPKRSMVNLARLTRNHRLRRALVPTSSHGGATGPGYTSVMSDFVAAHWSPERAGKNAPSLARCLERLRELPA